MTRHSTYASCVDTIDTRMFLPWQSSPLCIRFRQMRVVFSSRRNLHYQIIDDKWLQYLFRYCHLHEEKKIRSSAVLFDMPQELIRLVDPHVLKIYCDICFQDRAFSVIAVITFLNALIYPCLICWKWTFIIKYYQDCLHWYFQVTGCVQTDVQLDR
jgi:hypothetical protein